jgi:hypothetical protein
MNQAIDAVRLAAAEVAAWRSAEPTGTVDFTADRERFGTFWRLTEQLLARLPARPARGPAEAEAAAAIHRAARAARDRFLERHVEAVYTAVSAARRCGGGFAKQVAGNVEKGEAPTLLRERLEICLDVNLDGLIAGINLDTDRSVAKVNLVASSVFSSNDSVGHSRSAPRDRRRSRPPCPVPSQADSLSNSGLERCGSLDQASSTGSPKRPTARQ